MARTPLLRAIRRRMRECLLAEREGLAVASLRERQAAARRAEVPGRRQFLAGMGTVAAALALPPAAFAKSRSGPQIVVVGAGIAGLSCALALHDHGLAAAVYDAADRPGGRIASDTETWSDGQVSEWGGEFIDSDHTTMRRLAKRFQLPLDDLTKAEAEGAEDTRYFFDGYYSKTQFDADFAPAAAAVQADLDAVKGVATYAKHTPAAARLDQMNLYDWIDSRVPGGHASALGQLLDLAYVTEFGADTHDQSALNLVYLLADQPAAPSASPLGDADQRFHIRGGNERLPAAIAKHLRAADLHFNRRLLRVAKTAGGRYQLNFAGDGGATLEVLADIVVLALPFAVLRGVDYTLAAFEALKHQAIQQLGAGHNGKIQLQFNSRPWRGPGPWGIATGSSYGDTGYQAGWEVTRAQPGASGILSFYSGGGRALALAATTAFATTATGAVPPDVAATLAQAEPVFPGLTAQWNGRASEALPHLHPFFGASRSYYRPGQYTAFGGYEGVALDRMFFCGEHTSMAYRGTMEGGASEGRKTALDIVALLRQRAAPGKRR